MTDDVDSKLKNGKHGDNELSHFDSPEDMIGFKTELLLEEFEEICKAFAESDERLLEAIMKHLAKNKQEIDDMPFHKRLYTKLRIWLNL
jgi:hypothetical protein